MYILNKEHRPPHIYLDNACYSITASTFYKKNYFDTNEKKQLILDSLNSAIANYDYYLYAWCILDNHYHILIKTKLGKLLSKFISRIHGKSAIELNKLDAMPGRQIWYQYWDYCIRDEADFWKHFNYIHHNPLKHGYLNDQKLVAEYSFSSYRSWRDKKSEEWLNDCFAKYPIVDFTQVEENFLE